MTRMPAVRERVKELTGKDPHQGVNPDEVVAVGAGDPGRRAGRRRQGRAAARRHPADARDRDQRRRDDEADRAQHDDPDEEVGDLLDRRRQPALGRDPRPPGRARDGRAATRAWASSSSPGSRRRRAACRRSRSPSTSTPTASSTSPRKTWAPARSRRSRSSPAPGSPTRRSRAWSPTPRRTPRRTASSASWPRPATSPRTPPTRPRKQLEELGDKVDAATKEEIEAAIKERARVARLRERRGDQREDRGADRGVPQGLRADLRGGAAGAGRGRRRRPATARPRTTTRRSSTPRSSTRATTNERSRGRARTSPGRRVLSAQGTHRPLRSLKRPRGRAPYAATRGRRCRRGRGRISMRCWLTPSGSGTSTSSWRSGRKADFENYRKRMAPRCRPPQARGQGRGGSGVIVPVLDNLERALRPPGSTREGDSEDGLAARGAAGLPRACARRSRATGSRPSTRRARGSTRSGTRRSRRSRPRAPSRARSSR